jgi:integrase
VQSLDTRNEREARERFRKLLAERPLVARTPRDRAETLEALADAYVDAPHGWTRRSKNGIECRINAFLEAMGERTPPVTLASQVNARVLDEWRTARLKDVSRATVNRDEGVVTRWAAWCEAKGRWSGNPFRDRKPVKEPKRPKSRVIHSPAQVARMVGWALQHAAKMTKERRYVGSLEGWALTAATLEATGFRIEEARRMNETWLSKTGVTLTPEPGPAAEAWESKGYRPREVALSKESLAVLRRFITWRDTPHGKTKRSGVSERWFAAQADRAARALKLPESYRPHDARRRWITEQHRAGVPLKLVAELVGHAEVQTTERYVCTYYDDPVKLTAATPRAVTVLYAPAAKVLSMKGRKRRAG